MDFESSTIFESVVIIAQSYFFSSASPAHMSRPIPHRSSQFSRPHLFLPRIFLGRLRARQNRFHRNWLYTSWWNWTSWALTLGPSVRGQRSAAELAPSFLQFAQFFSPQLFISRMVPFVVATFNSRPPPPTVPESSFELKLPCTVIGKSVRIPPLVVAASTWNSA